MLQQLRAGGPLLLRLDVASVIRIMPLPFRAAPRAKEYGKVRAHSVAVPLCDIAAALRQAGDDDYTLRTLAPFLDGEAFVARAARAAGVALPLAIEAVGQLVRARLVLLTDMFQWSNVYACEAGVRALLDDAEAQTACQRAVVKEGHSPPPVSALFRLYAAFDSSSRVRDALDKHPQLAAGVDGRALVQFGVINGWLRRVHHYFIYAARDAHAMRQQQVASEDVEGLRLVGLADDVGDENAPPPDAVQGVSPGVGSLPSRGIMSSARPRSETAKVALGKLRERMNGRVSDDELCCVLGMSFHEIVEKTDVRDVCVLIRK